MEYVLIAQRLGRWLVVAAMLGFGLAMAQSEPSLNEVYGAVQAGKLEQAQVMIQQVLISHPNSAKAFYVRSEIFARQGDLRHARETLAAAEKLAPGLPFVKPASVQALRAQLSGGLNRAAPGGFGANAGAGLARPPSAAWALPLALAAGVIVLGYFMFRRRLPQPLAPTPYYAGDGGLNGPQTFGTGAAGVMQPGYGQPAGGGLGGRIMGGVATGLAVGAGVVAAEAIGRTIMGRHDATTERSDYFGGNDDPMGNRNADMGGQNFGITDAGSWDDAGSADVGGGGWDN